MKKIVRITTVPQSLKNLLKGQLRFMNRYYTVIGVSSNGPALAEVSEQEGVATVPINMTRTISPLRDLVAIFKLYTLFKKERPFIVHTHTPKAGILGMVASKLARIPFRLHTVAGMPLLETHGVKRVVLNIVERITYSCSTKVYPNSYGLRDIILSSRFCNSDKLKVICNGSSNGIDTEFFNPSHFSASSDENVRGEIGIDVEDFVFIYVGRLVSDKGINELIQAFRQLADEFSNLKLLLVGPFEKDLDPLEEETVKSIEECSDVIPVGYVNDVRPYYAMADVLAFPSYREGFPNAVMQAGAMGLPCIVTNINGCNEIIENEVNGLIINRKSTTELYSAMKRIFVESSLFKKLVMNARPMIESRYNQRAIWESILVEYKSFEKDSVK